jgi:hypothetical protein
MHESGEWESHENRCAVPSGGANGRGRLDKNKTSQQKKLAPAEAKNVIVTVDVITPT